MRAMRWIVVLVVASLWGTLAGVHVANAAAAQGSVLAWGGDRKGQLGDGVVGADSFRPAPQAVVNLSGVVALAGGHGYIGVYAGDEEGHSLALKSDGTVWAWGDDRHGQLGDGTAGTSGCFCSAAPQRVVGLTGMTAITAGSAHSLALKNDGTVWAWGNDGAGQLGDGTVGDGAFGAGSRAVPSRVVGLTGATAIAAGSGHSLALKADGTVWAWGNDFNGQLGDGTVGDGAFGRGSRAVPVQVVGLTGVVALAGGGTHSLALKGDGTVWAWGTYFVEREGFGGAVERSIATPFSMPGLTGVTALAAGDRHSLALQGDGTVWAWGADNYGQLGSGRGTGPFGRASYASPTRVVNMAGVTALAAGGFHNMALQGGLITPNRVVGLRGVTAVAAGTSHSLALQGDGAVWAWGGDSNGQLGDGTVGGDRATPSRVVGLTNVVAVAAGGTHSLAVNSDGTVVAWGANANGQLGDGTVGGDRAAPGRVAGLTDVTGVSAGAGHSLAVRRDGTVWAWGADRFGQLGDGTVGGDRAQPIQVIGLNVDLQAGVRAVAAGSGHSLALQGDGTVWAWGANAKRQLGDGGGGFPPLSPRLTRRIGLDRSMVHRG